MWAILTAMAVACVACPVLAAEIATPQDCLRVAAERDQHVPARISAQQARAAAAQLATAGIVNPKIRRCRLALEQAVRKVD